MRPYQITTLMAALAFHVSPRSVQAQAPAPPTNLTAKDHPWDSGERIDLTWVLSPDDESLVGSYDIYKAIGRIGSAEVAPDFEYVKFV